MQNLLLNITKFARHSKEGKVKFSEFIKEWSKFNLDNYVLNIENNRFVLDLGSTLASTFSILNLVFTIFILQYLNVGEWLTGILLFILTFDTQMRLIFLFLSFILPSSNIILDKYGYGKEGKNKKQIIICAHYDTKNCMISRPKGKIRGFIKYNIYSFSRMLTQYALLGNKAALPISIFLYVWWIMPRNSIETATFSVVRQDFVPYIISIMVFLITYGLLATVLMIALTLPFPKKLVNHGSDDNASGVIGALEIAKRLNDSKLYADIKIILFDNEERGLIGSSHFVSKNLEMLRKNKTIVINLDCIGRGSNVFALGNSFKDDKIYKTIEEQLRLKGTNVLRSDIDFSDHKPFLNKKITAISIGRYNLKRYLWIKKFPAIDWIHGSEDTPEKIDIGKIEEIVDTIYLALTRGLAPHSDTFPQG